jgi:hypothetical protein
LRHLRFHLQFTLTIASWTQPGRPAGALGLRTWDLFLNISQLENGELDAATDSLRQAVLLGPNRSESHYNLALAFARRGLLADAEREILALLRLEPGEPDERNMLGVIYALEGKTVRATLIWRELVRERCWRSLESSWCTETCRGFHAVTVTAVRTASLLEQRGFEPPVLFALRIFSEGR